MGAQVKKFVLSKFVLVLSDLKIQHKLFSIRLENTNRLTGGCNLVEGFKVLVLVVARNVVAKAYGGQRNEAVVESVQIAPLGLNTAEHKRWYEKEANKYECEHQDKMCVRQQRQIDLAIAAHEEVHFLHAVIHLTIKKRIKTFKFFLCGLFVFNLPYS